jgi:hypothetical protein
VKTLRERLRDADADPEILIAEGFDEAFLGLGTRCSKPPIVVYDRERCIEILARQMGEEAAVEYFEFNVEGAWLGEQTPLFLTRLEDE